ncbi:major facilitator superfamily protein, putative [Ichthyophthirius multifiliis]|uniref:Major facilitator superfamily protein, putative n=1 Tax=Ichthyophthirius multifiliis TaxID=5932 RepID=G0R6D4_ICHMU|nr:major facilitator superfamily protein, putative [Ichthyophthirius multifiliis]EGR26970.1 major facilitator superfamily protein, putative [Ichthyophthirius multifiliis]|eukprot:XP_004023854.1 major facilitator superfamily protein, putative [Ichthyophthirius multifiliis]
MVFFGGFLGSFIFSFLSDLKGRKIAFLCSWIAASVGVLVIAFSVNVYMLMVGFFIAGFGIYPSNTLNFIIMTEQSSGKFRVVTTAFILTGYTLSEGVLDGIIMYFPELFPTQIRGLALGLIRGVGISGSILSSFALQFSEFIGLNPVIFFGGIGISSTLCGFGLKETLNCQMKDQIEELEKQQYKLQEEKKV